METRRLGQAVQALVTQSAGQRHQATAGKEALGPEETRRHRVYLDQGEVSDGSFGVLSHLTLPDLGVRYHVPPSDSSPC